MVPVGSLLLVVVSSGVVVVLSSVRPDVSTVPVVPLDASTLDAPGPPAFKSRTKPMSRATASTARPRALASSPFDRFWGAVMGRTNR